MVADEVMTATMEEVKVPAQKTPLSPKKSLLDSLRDKHITNRVTEDVKELIPVTDEKIKEHWKCFTDKLKAQNKHSAVTVFNNAKLDVVNDSHFCVTVSASLEQKFIEQEKTVLLEYLKDCFHNRNLGLNVQIVDLPKEVTTTEATLSSRERYQKVIEQYPMIKELKDRLKLELDY
jgi:DNA polymerase-3 subunit gamma/tau